VADPSETTQVGSAPESDEPDSRAGSAEVLGAVQQLSAQVGNLQAEVQALRTESRTLPAQVGEASGWEDPRSGGPDMLTWVRALDAPGARGPAVPRLLLEIVFLVAVAVAAAIADLKVVEIVGVMAGAWILVALAELAAARSARRRAEAVYAPFPGLAPGYPTDPSWFAPPVERTVLDVVEPDDESRTKLPPPTQD
jgi:hypothetical protein